MYDMATCEEEVKCAIAGWVAQPLPDGHASPLPVRTIPTRSKRNGVDQHTYLMSLQERNERLFYYVLSQVCKRGAVLSCALGSAGCARPD